MDLQTQLTNRFLDVTGTPNYRHPIDDIEPEEEEDDTSAIFDPATVIAMLQFLVPPKPGKLRWSIALNRLAAMAYKVLPEVSGLSQAAIAEELGITRSAFCELNRCLEKFAGLFSGGHYSEDRRQMMAQRQRECWVDARRARLNEQRGKRINPRSPSPIEGTPTPD